MTAPRRDVTRSDRAFFAVQNTLKYISFAWMATWRGAVFRPFFAHAGARLRVHDGVTIKYPSEISLGDDVTINTGCFLVGLGGLTIGDNVMLGPGTKIVTTAHRFEQLDVPMQREPLETAEIVIGSDVWFGFDAKVMPGARIGDGAVIAAGAVVTAGEIPAFAVAAGVPARVVRTRGGAA